MCFQNAFLTRYQIVCVVLHKRCSLGIFDSLGHDLHDTHHSRGLPVTLSTKSIAFFHQTLDGKSRQLFESAQISEVCNDRLIISLFQETLKTDLYARLHCYMLTEFFFVSALKQDVILAVIFLYQSINICL